jgi:hypothetical protein
MDSKYEFAFASTKKWVKKTYPNLSEVEIEIKSKEILEKYRDNNLARDIEEKNQNEIEFNKALDKEFMNLYIDSLDD